MKQGKKQPFHEYYVSFEKALAEAGGIDWPDAVKRTFLEGGLNEQLKRILIPVSLPEGYTDMVNQLMLTASRLETTYSLTYGNPTPAPTGRTSPAQSSHTKDASGDTVMTGMNPFDKKKPKGQGQSKSSRTRAAWAFPEEMQRRRDEGSCLRCGKQGHRVASCKMKPARRPSTQVHSIETSQDPSESSGAETPDSGKE